MGIHLMAPLFEIVLKPGLEQLILQREVTLYSTPGISSDMWQGNAFYPLCNFELTRIEVQYGKYPPTYCATGILHLYDTPTDQAPLPDLIATDTIGMPSLPEYPDCVWVSYKFNKVPLEKDHKYLFLSEGCTPYLSEPYHCTRIGYKGGVGWDYAYWIWNGKASPPYVGRYKQFSTSYKIWGIPT